MILHITNWRQRGGGTAVARLLAAAEGESAHLLYLEEDAPKSLRQFGEREYECAPWAFGASHALFCSLLARGGRLLVHSHGRKPGFHARLARAKLGARVRIIHSFHGIASFAPAKKWISAAMEAALSPLTDGVVAAGPAELRLFRHLPLACPSYLSMPSFTPTNIAPIAVKGSATRIGFAGRMAAPKLHADLIRTVADYNRNAEQPLTLVLAGDGPDAKVIEALGRRLLGDRLEMCGHVTDMRSFYESLDVFAFFSRFEGLPLALIDAMACGLPCMATDVIGCNTLIQHEHNGLLTPVNDPMAAVATLRRLVTHKILRQCLGTQARADMLEHHAPARFIADYHSAYREAGYPMTT